MINIIKASGELVPFIPEKLRISLSKVGANQDLIEQIINEVNQSLYEGMTTKEIYRIAFQLLTKKIANIGGKISFKKSHYAVGNHRLSF